MRKIISAIMAVLGLSTVTQAAEPAQKVDINSIRYSMPTVAADDIKFVMPSKESFEGAPQFHEDEWCQIEFFQSSRLAELQKLMTEYKVFEQENRTQYGWNKIYARRIKRDVMVPGIDAEKSVAKAINASIRPSPILTTASKPLGQVQSGFTLELPGSVFLYGQKSSSGVTSLGAIVRNGGDDGQLVKAFINLTNAKHLILVDWRAQQILVSVGNDGKISAWRP